MTTVVLNTILNIGLAILAIVLLVGLIRGRRVDYRDISAAEVIPEVAEGEELLRDALSEQRFS